LLLVLTGWTAVLVAYALFRSGRIAPDPGKNPGTVEVAFEGTLAQGGLLLVSFAAFAALERKNLRPLALAGLLSAAFMMAVAPVYTSWQIRGQLAMAILKDPAHVLMTKSVQTGVLTAALLCLVPFVLIPRIQRVGRIVQLTTVLYMSVAYLTALLYIWNIDSQRVSEALTTLLIPAGACMLGVFALHKFLEIRPRDPLTTVQEKVHMRCPRCQCEQDVALGESRCARCRLRITVAVEEPLCPNCHFNLHNLTRPVCPECGFQLDKEDVPKAAG